MHSLLSICMNEKTSFTKIVLLSSLNARTDHDVWSNKLRHKMSTTPNLIPSSVIFNWDTVKDVDLLQYRKFRQIGSNLVPTCSSRPN